MKQTFKEYQLKENTQTFITLNGFIKPTPIQQEVIGLALKGKDIIGVSETGTGKTHAFLIPIMEKINTSRECVQAVITAPTRELAMQIHQRSKMMSKANPELRIKLVMGGTDRDKSSTGFKEQPHLVIGTPGRIRDLFINQEILRVDTADIFVVDEADMTLEYGFLEDIDAIAGKMKNSLQMMAFSATLPQSLKPFLKKYMKQPQTVMVESEHAMNPQIEHVLIPCKHRNYEDTLLEIMPGFSPYVCLVFANSREQAAKTAKVLREHQIDVLEMHGDLQPRQRRQAMKQLQDLKQTYVIATDIAARGIDIEGISHVVSMGFPNELPFYIHRAGRTGRSGRKGTCFALYQESDEKAIKELKERNGIHFAHRSFKEGKWTELKPHGQKRIAKNDLEEKEISKMMTRKNEKVKPGYKKKKAEAVKKIKQKRRQEMIRADIKVQRKEKYKAAQRAKTAGDLL